MRLSINTWASPHSHNLEYVHLQVRDIRRELCPAGIQHPTDGGVLEITASLSIEFPVTALVALRDQIDKLLGEMARHGIMD